MIVDSHAHVFPPMGGPSGHRSTREHMRYVQHLLLFHHMPVHRVSDDARVDVPPPYDGDDLSIAGLSDVNYRSAGFGRFAWTIDGVDYRRLYLPPTLTDLKAPPELMVAQMDYVGVDRAVIQTGHIYGRLNRYISNAVRKFPDRLWGLAMIDEWRADRPSQIRALDRAINDMGLHGVWFQSSNLALHNRAEMLDDPVFSPFWDRVSELHVPVFWYVTSSPGRDAYMRELAAFGRWVRQHPAIPTMLTHGLPLSRFMENGEITIPEEVWEHMSAPNVMVEFLIPIFQGAIWEYPYVEARPIVRQYYERLGPDHLAWGSDMPNVERHCTYRQSLDYLRRHCDFIPPGDMDKICGGNVARLFGA